MVPDTACPLLVRCPAAYRAFVMQCVRCGAGNAAGRRFCGACGAALAVACAACDFVNEPGVAFCGGCGQQLAAASADRSRAAPERRHVAVLFVDLVGYTRLTGELGAEDTRALLDAFFAALDGVVERHGGTVAQHLGDCVMALFGAPVARGDDVERAVRAALAMLAATRRLSAEIGRNLSVHVGLAVGDVVAGGTGSDTHRIYTVTGEAVNMAARLAERAGPDELLVSDSIRLALAGPVQLEDLGLASLPGIAQPVRLHRLLGLGAASPAGGSGLVGRTAELHRLADLVSRARSHGRGGLIVVRGDAGIGKTRLLGEVRLRADRQGVACATALVIDFGAGEGSDVLRVLAGALLGCAEADQAARERAVAAMTPPAPPLRPFLRDLLDLPLAAEARNLLGAMPESDRRRARQRAFAAVLAEAAARQPWLLIVEDVHWAGLGTLDDLAAAARTIGNLPIVLIVSTRREGDPLDAPWRDAAGPTPVTVIDLYPLGAADAHALALQLLAGTDERLAERCVARAQGNPLFLEQLSRHLRERGDDAVPATVQTLIQARLDRLAPGDREALRAAAVLGQRFELTALRAILDRADYVPQPLVQRLLLRPLGDDLLFAHALIRDAVYDLLLPSRRRELHRRAAAYFSGHDAILHAQHLDRAGEPTAGAAYAVAARQQTAAYRSAAALELAARGQELATARAERYELACLVGRAQLDLGRAGPAQAAFADALALADDAVGRSQAELGLAETLRLQDRLEEALARLAAAEAAIAGLDEPARLSSIQHLRGNILFPLGRVAECASAHRAALDQALRTGSPELEARAQGGLGDAEYALGRMLSAHRAFSRCCALARAHGHARIEAANLPMVAVTSGLSFALDRATQEADAAVALAERVGHPRGALIAQHAAWIVALLRGDLAAAAARGQAAQALTAQLGARRFEAENLMFVAEAHMLRGERATAADVAAQAMAISRETAIEYMGPIILGMVAWAAPDRARRTAALAEAETLLEVAALGHNHLMLRRYAIEAALAAADWDEAERHATALAAFAAAEPLPWSEIVVARARHLAACGRSPGETASRAALQRLRDDIAGLGADALLPAIDAALAG